MKLQAIAFLAAFSVSFLASPAFPHGSLTSAATAGRNSLATRSPQQPPGGGTYTGPGDIVINNPCPNTPCGAPTYDFSGSCYELTPPMIARELFRPDARVCWLPQGSPLAFWRDQFSFRRCSFDELVQKVASGQVTPDANGNVVVSLGTSELLNTDCGITSSKATVPNGQMITVAESGWLNGLYLQGSAFPNCNTPLPIKVYLRKIFPNGSQTCFSLTAPAVAAGNPMLPHGATILRNAFSYWIGPPPTAPAECFRFELLIEFDYQCMRNILLRWDTQMPDPMWSGERLLAVRVLSCDPCGVAGPGSDVPGEDEEGDADIFHYYPGDTVFR